ncbi:c-di-GMP-binding flagellar brake protein YcgR, contains PilZNR and PilZ domains [Burkholderia sp. OK233]|nr:c-di-GMP-binding flagellar brake protein YcgR, contains PilZNR and PilZ domains [Burkholderia sp. OK233]
MGHSKWTPIGDCVIENKNTMSTDTEAVSSGKPESGLQPDEVPVGMPLDWPVVGADGMPLLDRGAILARREDRDFLFRHFQPRRDDRGAQPAPAAPSSDAIDPHAPVTIEDLGLSIGMRLGMRPQIGMGREMHASRVIGFALHHALFVTPLLINGQPLALAPGEQLEVVAIASRAVFLFVCTVEAVCTSPFPYLVLSEPGAIRRLRMRRSVRVRVRLAVRYTTVATGATGSTYEGLGVTHDLSPLGMSLAVPAALGQPGDHVHVAFRIRMDDINLDIEAVAVLRSVQTGQAPDGLTVHGLEFDQLEPTQQIALKCFVLERAQAAIG